MIDMDAIQSFSQSIVQEFHPEQIILFGSYAYGTPNEDSDVDMLVLMPYQGHPAEKSVEIMLKLHPIFPLDLLVRTPEQFRQRIEWNDWFMREISEKGKVLHDASHA